MKRTYRIEVEFEATFERKVGARAWAKRIRELCEKAAPAGWSVTRTNVHSRAVPKPAAPPPVDPQETIREQALSTLQDIATKAARFVPSAPTPRVKQWPSRFCGPSVGDRSFGHAQAHAHIQPGKFWAWTNVHNADGTTSRRDFHGLGRTRGIICVPARTLDGVASGSIDPVHLMLHEVAHLRFRTGHDHDGHRYMESLERLERDYYLNVIAVEAAA